MNLSDLTKEQKQYIILGIIGVVGVGAALFIGIRFAVSSMADAKTELADLTEKVDRAERELARKKSTRENLYRTISEIEGHLNYIPPEQNYYSWATEIVYSKGRAAGLEIQSVDEVGMAGGESAQSADPVYFETYSLRITARGGYAETKAFLGDIEENHPLVRFTGIEISRGNNPEAHDLQLFVQWPFNLNRIAKLWEEESAKSKAFMAKTEARAAQERPEPVAEKPATVVVAEPIPKPVEPAPVVAKKPTPPAPRTVAKPVPVVEEPAPVVALTPAFTPKPPVEKAAPVIGKPSAPVVAAKPAPQPKPVKLEPVAAKPAPVIVSAPAPEPKPEAVEPIPVVMDKPVVKAEPQPMPSVKELAPVVVSAPVPGPESNPAQVTPEPIAEKPAPVVAKAEPAREEDHVADILASIDQIESSTEEPEPVSEENEMASLLASLGSRGEASPELQAVEAPEAADLAALAAYVEELQEQPVLETTSTPEVAVEAVVPISTPDENEPVHYVSSGKSAKILEELLSRDKPKESTSLGSFLDGIVGDINDK